MERKKEILEALARKQACRFGEKIKGKPLPKEIENELLEKEAVFKAIRDARTNCELK